MKKRVNDTAAFWIIYLLDVTHVFMKVKSRNPQV